MFERYTEGARRTLFFARYEASVLRGRAIASEHLLLGLLRERKGVLSNVFAINNITYDRVVEQIGREDGEPLPTSVEIPFAEETHRILHAAAAEADLSGVSYIGSEHLLLGLLHETESVAGRILHAYGLDVDRARAEVSRLLAEPAESSPSPADIARWERLEGAVRLLRKLQHMAGGTPEAKETMDAIRRILDGL